MDRSVVRTDACIASSTASPRRCKRGQPHGAVIPMPYLRLVQRVTQQVELADRGTCLDQERKGGGIGLQRPVTSSHARLELVLP